MSEPGQGLRVAVTGATGNSGTSVVQALSDDDRVRSIRGVARRRPTWSCPKLEMVTADVAEDDLDEVFADVDVIIHLAWLFQPTHDAVTTWRANVLGSLRVFEAAARSGAKALVHSSSVGAYSPGRDNTRLRVQARGRVRTAQAGRGAVATRGLIHKSGYSRRSGHLDLARHLQSVVASRPYCGRKECHSGGPLRAAPADGLVNSPPGKLVRPELIPLVPDLAALRFQAVHSADIGDAFRLAALTDARGAYNVAADPVVDTSTIAELLHARTVRVPAGPVRAVLAAAWRLHLVPASPCLFDAVLRLPLMDSTRARVELGWSPRFTATEAVQEFLSGPCRCACTWSTTVRMTRSSSAVRSAFRLRRMASTWWPVGSPARSGSSSAAGPAESVRSHSLSSREDMFTTRWNSSHNWLSTMVASFLAWRPRAIDPAIAG